MEHTEGSKSDSVRVIGINNALIPLRIKQSPKKMKPNLNTIYKMSYASFSIYLVKVIKA